MTHTYCDWCGTFFNWVFPDPQTLIYPNKLYFCKKKCLKALNKKRAQQKLKKKGIIA